jgi:hypothetical protein
MSRTPPAKPHVLRTAAIGVSTISIKRIEGGTMKVSRPMAQRISAIFRLDFQQLLDNSDPERPIIYPASNEVITEETIQREADQLRRIILDTLLQTKTPMRFWTLRNVINQKIFEAREEFGIRVKTYSPRDFDWTRDSRQKAAASRGFTRFR